MELDTFRESFQKEITTKKLNTRIAQAIAELESEQQIYKKHHSQKVENAKWNLEHSSIETELDQSFHTHWQKQVLFYSNLQVSCEINLENILNKLKHLSKEEMEEASNIIGSILYKRNRSDQLKVMLSKPICLKGPSYQISYKPFELTEISFLKLSDTHWTFAPEHYVRQQIELYNRKAMILPEKIVVYRHKNESWIWFDTEMEQGLCLLTKCFVLNEITRDDFYFQVYSLIIAFNEVEKKKYS